MQVYAAEAQAAELKPEPVEPTAGKHGVKDVTLEQHPVKPVAALPAEKGPAKQAEEAWNERIKGAYAAVAASTPYRPAPKKPSSNALSWHRSALCSSNCAVSLLQLLLT